MKKLLILLLLISLTLQTNASAAAEIRPSADGKDVLVPVDAFRAWQAELNELDLLREYKIKMDSLIGEWENKILSLEVALEQERRASDATMNALHLTAEKYKRRSKAPGLGIGFGWSSAGEWAAMAGVVWKIDGLFPW